MKKDETKSYPLDLKTRYDVTFTKDFGAFKKGDSTSVTLPIAMKWIASGVVSETDEVKTAIKKSEVSEVMDEMTAEAKIEAKATKKYIPEQ